MSRCVVDTNVPIVANGRADEENRRPTINCRIAAVKFLQRVLTTGTVLLDLKGGIQEEYRRHLNPSGQPGVGDRFYQVVLHSAPRLIERVDLPLNAAGEFVDLPVSLVEAGFDPSDRKFAAMARRENVAVVNATDSDWVEHAHTLESEGIAVKHLCGCDRGVWFTA